MTHPRSTTAGGPPGVAALPGDASCASSARPLRPAAPGTKRASGRPARSASESTRGRRTSESSVRTWIEGVCAPPSRAISSSSPYCTSDGHAVSQARQPRQRSSGPRASSTSSPPATRRCMMWMRPRGPSDSSASRSNVGQAGRQRPHETHLRASSSKRSRRSSLRWIAVTSRPLPGRPPRARRSRAARDARAEDVARRLAHEREPAARVVGPRRALRGQLVAGIATGHPHPGRGEVRADREPARPRRSPRARRRPRRRSGRCARGGAPPRPRRSPRRPRAARARAPRARPDTPDRRAAPRRARTRRRRAPRSRARRSGSCARRKTAQSAGAWPISIRRRS